LRPNRVLFSLRGATSKLLLRGLLRGGLTASIAHVVERQLALSLLAHDVVLPVEVDVMIGVLVGGLGALSTLAVLIGVALDREGRQSAWDRIAEARRINAEQVRDVKERQTALDVLEEELDSRDRRLDFREYGLFEREAALELLERSVRAEDSSSPDIAV